MIDMVIVLGGWFLLFYEFTLSIVNALKELFF